VLLADSVQQAMELVHATPPDVLISDIAMPQQDGYDLVRALRANSGDNGSPIPAIALSAYASDDDKARSLAAGFSAHLPKPIEPVELIAAIRKLTLEPRAFARSIN